MNSQEFIMMEQQFGAHNYRPLDVVLTNGEGVWVTDVEGNKYLDFLSAYSAVNQGHCHPKILAACIEQAKTLTLTSRAFRNNQLPILLKKLHDLTGYDQTLLMNSGAEAVETAIKAARKWGYTIKGIPEQQAEIICASDNFHGRTTTIISFSTESQYRSGFGPFTPGFKIVQYGDIEELKEAITDRTAAILLEPIQGESGIVVPPEGYLSQAAQLCKDHRVLLMIDEIQSGLGRSGKLFAYEYEHIRPDVLIIGKALGGGFYPISAVLADKQILDVFQPGDHGSTFGGNPLACAIAVASLDVITEEKLVERSYELGNYFRNKLKTLRSKHIQQIRGKGLWIGIVLDTNARPYCEALMKEGILCKDTHEHIIRFAPPLIITKHDLDWAFERILKVITTLE